jgi:hypothetical protein
MTDTWVVGLQRFRPGTDGGKWTVADGVYHFGDFYFDATPDERTQIEAAVANCRVEPAALDSLEANIHSFFEAATTEDDRVARWQAVSQAIEIIRWKMLVTGVVVPATFDRARFLVMAYPADVGLQPLLKGEPARDRRLYEALVTWLALLDRHEQLEEFGNWKPADIAAECRYVTQRLGVQKDLSRPRQKVFAATCAGFAADHLLPRYDLLHAWTLSRRLHRWPTMATITAPLLLVFVPFLLRFGSGSPRDHLVRAAFAGGLALTTLVLTAAVSSSVVVYPHCLRLPAGAAVGMAAVLSTDRILQTSPAGWQILVPIGAFFGYVAFEARQHNASLVFAKAALMTALGLLYGVAVAAVALSIVSPSFPVAGSPGQWGWGNGHDVLPMVAFRGAVAVLMGTLLQVLWSDRTVASPLDRMTWRKS